MNQLILWSMIAAAVPTDVSPAAAMDKQVETLSRTGKWVVNYDRDSCNLAVQLGNGDRMVIARFTRFEPGNRFDFALFGKRFFTSETRVEGTADFGLNPKPTEIHGLGGTSGKLRAMFFSSLRLDGWQRKNDGEVPPEVTPEEEARVTGVTVDLRGQRPFRLEFGSLGKPFAEMRRCMDNLVTHWGYDAAQQAAALRPASSITSPGTWLNSDDYPTGAYLNGHNGMVQFRLDVDAEGKVAGCYILSRTSPDEFADVTCRAITKRARLQPALDAQGRPMRSYYVNKVLWLAQSK